MVNAVGPVQRNVIVVTIDLKKGKYNDLQALFESDAGLKQPGIMKVVIMLKDF